MDKNTSLKNSAELPIKWRGFESDFKEKSSDWIWYIASGAMLVIIVAFFMENYFFIGLIILATFVTIIMGLKKPEKFDFSIEARGIGVGPKLYSFNELRSFWIHYDPPTKKDLIIRTKGRFLNHIKIPLENVDPVLVRNILIKTLDEIEEEESFLDIITDRIGL